MDKQDNQNSEDDVLEGFVPTEEDFAQADAEVAMVQFSTGKFEDGTEYWAYIAIPPSKYVAFKEIEMSGKPIIFEDFGEIIAEGEGSVPPAEVQEELSNKYGLDIELEAKLEKAIKDLEVVAEDIGKRLVVEKYSGNPTRAKPGEEDK